MAQHDYVIDNSTGANVRADINSALQAIVTNNSGSSAPSSTFPFMLFADTSAGTMKIRNAADNGFIELFQLDGTFTLEDGSASTPALAFRDDLNTGIFSGGENEFNIATGGTERFVINSSGIVGINISSPDSNSMLDVMSDKTGTTANSNRVAIFRTNGGSRDAHITLSNSSNTPVHIGQLSSSLYFSTGGTERFVINSSGNCGIGTAIPSRKLHVASSFIRVDDGFGLDSSGSTEKVILDNGFISFTAASSERMRINSSGNVLVGTTGGSLSTSSFGIALFSGGAINNFANVNGTSSAFRSGGNQGEAKIMGDGDLQNTNNSYGQISDETLKQDIVDAASQWNDIKNLRVRKFRFKDNPTGILQIGVVAQEIETVSAGLVKTNEEGIKSVKYSVLYMKAVKCLQEAMAKIETLETKVAALEAA